VILEVMAGWDPEPKTGNQSAQGRYANH